MRGAGAWPGGLLGEDATRARNWRQGMLGHQRENILGARDRNARWGGGAIEKAITLRLEECTHERLVVDKVREGRGLPDTAHIGPLGVHVRAGLCPQSRGWLQAEE